MRTNRIFGFIRPARIGQTYHNQIENNTPEGGQVDCTYKVIRESNLQEYLSSKQGQKLGDWHTMSGIYYYEVQVLD